MPMFQQPPGNAGDPDIIRFPPGIDAPPDVVDQVQCLGAPGVVAGIEDFVTGGTPFRYQSQRTVAGLLPVLERGFVGGIYDEGLVVIGYLDYSDKKVEIRDSVRSRLGAHKRACSISQK
jgi:hypothetical protein